MLEQIQSSHPLVYRNFSDLPGNMGERSLRQITELDDYWGRIDNNNLPEVIRPVSELPPGTVFNDECELFYAGGTLGMLHAAVMAAGFGRKVILIDRGRAGTSTRDWNISRKELMRLAETGVFTEKELEQVIVRSYNTGWVEFFAEEKRRKRLYIDHVLDCAVDADMLLGIVRRKLEGQGKGVVYDGMAFVRCFQAEDFIVIETLDDHGRTRYYKAAVFIDVMGVLSPVAMQLNRGRPHTHVCPTVGTIASGFLDADYDTGEILASTEHADMSSGSGRQLIWEGFPAKESEYITYLFFYDGVDSDNDKSLLGLFETYFRKLDTYKQRGPEFRIHRPVFGIIPAYAHDGLGRTREIASDRILLFGDAATLGSPLTFCGFGSLVRNIPRLTSDLDAVLSDGRCQQKDLERISAFEPNVASMSNLMKYMCFNASTDAPDFVNELMNEVMIVLDGLPERYREAMFRDEMKLEELVTVLLKVAWRYPKVLRATLEKLGVGGTVSFLKNLAGWALSPAR
jgi:lycopene cyclase CruA